VVIKSLSISAKLVSLLGILLMLGVISSFIWVILAPRSLSSITPYIQGELNKISPNYKVKVDDSSIRWDSFRRSFIIDISDITILNDTSETIASFPSVSFDFSVIRLLRGQILSSDLTINNPSFYIYSSQKAMYVTPNGNDHIVQDLAKRLAEELKSNNFNFPINSIHLKDADLFIDNGMSEFAWHVTDGYVKVDTFKKKNKIIAELNINFGHDSTYFGAEAAYQEDGSIDTKIKFTELPSYISYDLFPKLDVLKNLSVKASGDVNILLSQEKISQVNFNFNKISGKVNISDYIKRDLDIKSLKAKGSLYDDFTLLTLDNLDADINNSNIIISGSFKNHGTFTEISPEIRADVTVNNLKVDEVAGYWPPALGPVVREWVTTNITGGNIPSAKGSFIFTPEDFANIKKWAEEELLNPVPPPPPPVPDTAINAIINVEDTNVHYFPGYPDVKSVSGTVKFSGITMLAEANNGKILNSAISKASLTIPDLWQHNILLDIQGNFSGPVEDGIVFLKESMHGADESKLANIYKSTGAAEGSLSLSIPVITPLKYDDIGLDINAKISNAIIPDVINKYALTGGQLTINVKNYAVDASGKGTLNETPVEIGYSADFKDTNDTKTKYHLAGEVTPKFLTDLSIATIPFISGGFGLDVTMQEEGKTKLIEGTADLTKSQVSIAKVSFEKATGVNAQVKFNAIQKEDSSVEIKSFSATGDGISASGSLNITSSELSSMILNNAKFGHNDFNAKYNSDANGFSLDLKGASIDLSGASFSQVFQTDKKNKKNIDINAEIANVYMKNGEVLKNFKANANCTPKTCKSLNIYGKLRNDNYVALSLKPLGDRSALMTQSDNAGALVSALGISQNIQGGSLNLESTFAAKDITTIAQGLITMRDFTAIKTPLLGKVLTIASLQGIQDLLNNQGITFKKFDAPFTMANGIITVTDAKSAGASVGITASGTIDTAKGEVDLKGVIVPAYEINKALGKIPLVGGLLTGKKNEGVFATRYRIKGPTDDVQVTVNPLSILTPGFLRDLFDILPGG
jgi:hypothetical protein